MVKVPRSAAVVSLLLVVALVGCGSDDDDGDADASVPGGSDAVRDPSDSTSPTTPPDGSEAPDTSEPPGDGLATTLRSRYVADPLNLDPIYVGNGADYVNFFFVYESLVAPDPAGEGVVNVLAETWEVADDGLSVDFTLKPGVQFHDGYGEVTAEDVKFSLERAAGIIPSEVDPYAIAYYTGLERVDVTDTYSGTIVMSEPAAVLIEQAIPATAVIPQAAFDELGPDGLALHPVGTGPYEFDEAVPGEHVRYVNFADYSGSAPYVPDERFEEVVFSIISDDSTAELAYEAGDLDILVDIRPASVGRFEDLDNTTVSSGTSRGYRWIGMNVLDPALQNEDLRRAIIAAIDVPSIVEATSEGLETRATALLAPSAPMGYWADAPVQEQDLDEARRLVELVPEADRSLTFTIADDDASRTVAQVAQQNLEDAGLSVEILPTEPANFLVTGESVRERQISYIEFEADFREPSLGFLWFTCDQIDVWNYMYWCNEEYDALLDEAKTTLDPEARGDIYIRMQELWHDANHTVWISHPTVFTAARSDTVEVLADPAGTVFWQGVRPL